MPPEVVELLKATNPAVIATADLRNRPVSVTTWYTLQDDGHILLSIMTQGARGGRLNHLRNNPHVALTVMDASDWTNAVNLQGTVTGFINDSELEAIDAMAQRHLGRPFADRAPRTCACVKLTHWDYPRRRW